MITVDHPDAGELVVGMRGRCKVKHFHPGPNGPYWDRTTPFRPDLDRQVIKDKFYSFTVKDQDGRPWVHLGEVGSPRRLFWSCNPAFFRHHFEYEIRAPKAC